MILYAYNRRRGNIVSENMSANPNGYFQYTVRVFKINTRGGGHCVSGNNNTILYYKGGYYIILVYNTFQ